MSKEREVPERRHYHRVFSKVPGTAGEVGLMIVNVSADGIGVVHVAPLPDPAGIWRARIPVRQDCAIVRTVKRSADNAARELFRSGLQP
jgi:hypothetical protein